MLNANKLLRSLIVFAPALQDARFRAEARMVRTLRRPYQPEFAGLRALALDSPLILDIGCSRGISMQTILAMRPDARIIGFEANAALAEKTKRWFAADPRVEILPFGLGSETSSIDLYLPRYRNYQFDGFGSAHRWAVEWMMNSNWLYWFDPRHVRIETVTAPIRRLDDLNLNPTVMKLYILKSELDILKGAAETIRRNEPIIMAPGDVEIDAALDSNGYKRYQWLKSGFVPDTGSNMYSYYMTPARYREPSGR
jgi:FkbM family methyltransferase